MLDNAVFVFGATLTNELESLEGKNAKEIERKRERTLRKWLGASSGTARRFRDPAKDVNQGG